MLTFCLEGGSCGRHCWKGLQRCGPRAGTRSRICWSNRPIWWPTERTCSAALWEYSPLPAYFLDILEGLLPLCLQHFPWYCLQGLGSHKGRKWQHCLHQNHRFWCFPTLIRKTQKSRLLSVFSPILYFCFCVKLDYYIDPGYLAYRTRLRIYGFACLHSLLLLQLPSVPLTIIRIASPICCLFSTADVPDLATVVVGGCSSFKGQEEPIRWVKEWSLFIFETSG